MLRKKFVVNEFLAAVFAIRAEESEANALLEE
jgi:hypothetical protein